MANADRPQIVACTAKTTLTVAAGSTIVGFGCGIIFVSYAGIQELVPNKWRGLLGLTELGKLCYGLYQMRLILTHSGSNDYSMGRGRYTNCDLAK